MKYINLLLSGCLLSAAAIAKMPLNIEADLGFLTAKDKQYHKTTITGYGTTTGDTQSMSFGTSSFFGQLGASSGFRLNKRFSFDVGAYYGAGYTKEPYDSANAKNYCIQKKRQISLDFMPRYHHSNDHSMSLIMGYGMSQKKFFGLFNSSGRYIADSKGPEMGVKFDARFAKKVDVHLKAVFANMTDHKMKIAKESVSQLMGTTTEQITKPNQRSFDTSVSIGISYNILG